MAKEADAEMGASRGGCFLGSVYVYRRESVTDSNEAKIKTA